MAHLLAGLLDPAHADRTVTVAGRTTTYAALLRAAGDLAPRLATLDRVAVHATTSLATVEAVVAALLSGTTVVPLAPDAGVRERDHVLALTAPDAWVGEDPGAAARHGLPRVAADGGEPSPRTTPPDEPGPRRAAVLLSTSGTTGPPKAVVLSRAAVAAGLDALADAWDWTDADTLAHGLPLFHSHGLLLGVVGALRVGSPLLHVGRPTPAAYAGAARAGATLFFGVPTVWSRIADSRDDAAALADARLLVSGSAALPRGVLERLRALTGHHVVERYGMTETMVTLAARADEVPRAGGVGRPVAGVETRLRDEHDRPVPPDGASVGGLQLRGPTLCDGYLGDPAADAAAWTDDGWFRTGDLAVVDPDGHHRIVGRASADLISSGGYRIGAGEVEATLLDHPRVAEAAVVGEDDPDLGQRVAAHVVLRDAEDAGEPVDEAALADELAAYVAEHLSVHKRPRAVHVRTSLPRNALGKVRKQDLG